MQNKFYIAFHWSVTSILVFELSINVQCDALNRKSSYFYCRKLYSSVWRIENILHGDASKEMVWWPVHQLWLMCPRGSLIIVTKEEDAHTVEPVKLKILKMFAVTDYLRLFKLWSYIFLTNKLKKSILCWLVFFIYLSF